MSFDPNKFSSSRFGGLGDRGSHTANILKRTLMDGRVKVYEDETKKLEKTEILADKGTIAFNVEYVVVGGTPRLKSIDIFSLDNEPLGTLDVITDSQTQLHPIYRFSYGGNQLGQGTGDVASFIAQKILGADNLDPRYLTGSSVDEEVITTITKLLERKTL